MRRGVRIPTLMGLAALLCAGVGCGRTVAPSQSGHNPGTMGDDADAESDQPTMGEISGTDWHIPWMIHDANGKTIPALIADAQQGEMNNLDDNNTMRLHGVKAKLFQEGVHAADVVADQVDANSADHIILGTGHLRVTSLTNPPDTVVTGDKISWDPHSDIMVVVGHAKVTQRPPKGVPITQTGGRITFDTKLQKFEVTAQ